MDVMIMNERNIDNRNLYQNWDNITKKLKISLDDLIEDADIEVS